jgi:polysaccharide deacetylase 2 family uncharacterized protein YibQ
MREENGRRLAARDPEVDRAARPRSAARVLAWFWGPVLLLLVAGAAVLQVLGPPVPQAGVVATHQAAQPPAATPAPPRATPAPVAAMVAPAPPAPGAPVAAPDPALLEPSTAYPGAMLPRIGADGRLPMQVYAAGYDPADKRPRIALLLAGMGMSDAESEAAVTALPAAVSLAISPYAAQPEKLLEAARAHGHETLISIPMEPQNYPVNDAGSYQLLTADPPPANALRLEWALSRITGYVGATGALGQLHGERFAADPQMGALLEDLAKRGLLYIDPRPGAAAPASHSGMPPSRDVDVVIDEPPAAAAIDAKLASLEQIAHDRGAALGLADGPTPVTIGRIAAWAATLAQRGFVLVPVSALVPMAALAPAKPPVSGAR